MRGREDQLSHYFPSGSNAFVFLSINMGMAKMKSQHRVCVYNHEPDPMAPSRFSGCVVNRLDAFVPCRQRHAHNFCVRLKARRCNNHVCKRMETVDAVVAKPEQNFFSENFQGYASVRVVCVQHFFSQNFEVRSRHPRARTIEAARPVRRSANSLVVSSGAGEGAAAGWKWAMNSAAKIERGRVCIFGPLCCASNLS